MIAITNIEYEEVDGGTLRMESYSGLNHGFFAQSIEDMNRMVSIETEVIEGLRFITPEGKTICVGYSKQAERVLGIGYKAFRNQERQNNMLRETIEELKKQLRSGKSVNNIIKNLDKINLERSIEWTK